MCYIEESLTTRDGARLYVRKHEAERPRAELILVHGFGEHSGRYGPLTMYLVDRSYSVTAYDQRGHGQSDGLPGYIDRFDAYGEDLESVIATVRSRTEQPLFIIAHSMGSLVALRYLALGSSVIAGAVLSAPLLAVAVKVPAHKVMIARVGAHVAPRLRLDNEIDPAVLSRDPEVGRAYASDPLVHHVVSPRWFAEAKAAMEQAITSAPDVRVPLLVMHGSDDRLASVDATKRTFPRLGSQDKQLEIYDGYYHELFNEPEKQEIYNTVVEWLDARTA
ncbi:MAG TPA: alpha/beta hydrolase [Blastocatellia bacterium]|nr:alpha/beta hydrolase [Blastocatellia bacterium]